MDDFLFRYRVLDCSVVDGDTVDLSLDLGMRLSVRERFRLFGPDHAGTLGLDAPELNTPEGKAAKDWLAARLAGAELVARTVKDKREKYGRLLVVIWARRAGDEWRNVNFELMAAGHARLKGY